MSKRKNQSFSRRKVRRALNNALDFVSHISPRKSVRMLWGTGPSRRTMKETNDAND
jgi:hypothetical protein